MIELYTDSAHRIAYSTDASAYRQVPLAVCYPRSGEDIPELLQYAREHHTCLIPRAGGTSIAGQVVGQGIVVDVSRYMNQILEVDPDGKWARVQPGIVRDCLNLSLKPYGLFFSPETSTSSRCCIGGMVGNNSCGTHSLIYGSTRHHVLALKGYLSDGTPFDTESWASLDFDKLTLSSEEYSDNALSSLSELEGKIFSQLCLWKNSPETMTLIRESFPDRTLKRRSCGYALDEALDGICGIAAPDSDGTCAQRCPAPFDFCSLLTGSEGTLAFITEIKLSLDPLPPKDRMLLCAHCHSLEDACKANLVALSHHPDAVELMDGEILRLASTNIEARKNMFFVQGEPEALLIAEISADGSINPEILSTDGRGSSEAHSSDDARSILDGKASEMEKELLSKGLSYCCTRVYGKDVPRVWALRKAGLGVLSSMEGDAKPVGVIEDTAVSPQRLPEYVADIRKMLSELGLSCIFYGHISTGELHLRPVLDLKKSSDRALFRNVALRTAQIVKKHRGSLSGEHGDGRLRGEFIPLLYGERCYELFCELKSCWDPFGVLNAGKIVDTPPMDSFLRYDVEQKYAVEGAHTLAFRDSAALVRCVEQCNGAAQCRTPRELPGRMCPAYRLSGDEMDSTRARANILREYLTRGGRDAASADESMQKVSRSDVLAALDSCLACKACRSECPSNVDMTRIRSEVLNLEHRRNGIDLEAFAVSRMAFVERLGMCVRPIYNFFACNAFTSSLLKKILGFSLKRSIPSLSSHTARTLIRHYLRISSSQEHSKGRVNLFIDEFTDMQEAELGLSFARLLDSLGYEVLLPRHCESGRAAISKGSLGLASKFATRNVSSLKAVVSEDAPLVGIEPSCILSFRDEYPNLVSPALKEDAVALAGNCLLYDEFLLREMGKGNISASDFAKCPKEIYLHGHCHQKALVGVEKTASVLEGLLDTSVHTIDAVCCGMAGSFGYEARHYETSMKIGEMSLFPSVRNATSQGREVIVAAPGTSCRTQIMDGTGVRALHPIEVLCDFLRQK